MNAATVFEPCCHCEKLFFRGPFHIVRAQDGILCLACAYKKSPVVARMIDVYYNSISKGYLTRALQGETSFRCIFGFYEDPADTKTTEELTAPLLEFMRKQQLLAIWSIGPNIDRRITHFMTESRDLQGPGFAYDSNDVFSSFYKGKERLFQSIEYIFTQIVDLQRYPEITPLKLPNEIVNEAE
jgi:hypothetical protein